jgi:PD-(D/E)XK nuclease superfamily
MFTWSYSKLKAFETCPKRHYHYDIAKDVKEEESRALKEGAAMHTAFEERVRDGKALPLPYAQHEPLMKKLIDAPGDTMAEQKLGLTKDFRPSAFFGSNVWFRTVLDFAKIRPQTAVVIDYKSGKVTDDDTQLALMSATLMHYAPNVEVVSAGFLFVNNDKLVSRSYNREGLKGIWREILPRVQRLEDATVEGEYPPRPSGLCIKYCAVTSCPHYGTGSRW